MKKAIGQLPSFSRKKLDYSSVVNAWHNLGDMLVNNLQKKGIEVSSDLEKWEAFHLFSLGIAQHYGLPSVGLDLTDNINVALWFALHNVKYDPYHPVEATPIDDKSDAYIFIFRSPRLTVFSYDNLNVTIGNERPVRQQAYFNYCGWGLAKNQLALNLAAVLKFNSSLLDYLPNAYTSYLFPNREQDPVLDTLLAIREKFKGTEFGNLLKDIYI